MFYIEFWIYTKPGVEAGELKRPLLYSFRRFIWKFFLMYISDIDGHYDMIGQIRLAIGGCGLMLGSLVYFTFLLFVVFLF